MAVLFDGRGLGTRSSGSRGRDRDSHATAGFARDCSGGATGAS